MRIKFSDIIFITFWTILLIFLALPVAIFFILFIKEEMPPHIALLYSVPCVLLFVLFATPMIRLLEDEDP